MVFERHTIGNMFTGIIEELGEVESVRKVAGGASIRIRCAKVLEGRTPGSSIAVNGACLSITDLSPDGFSAALSPETLSRTTLGRLQTGSRVNLERPLALGDSLDGHLVSGHVDGVGKVLTLHRVGDFMEATYRATPEIIRYIVPKGSVAVDGISLTIALVGSDSFKVAVIPETVSRTNIQHIKVGDDVNIECDVIGKYIERFLVPWRDRSGGITMERLTEEGYV